MNYCRHEFLGHRPPVHQGYRHYKCAKCHERVKVGITHIAQVPMRFRIFTYDSRRNKHVRVPQ